MRVIPKMVCFGDGRTQAEQQRRLPALFTVRLGPDAPAGYFPCSSNRHCGDPQQALVPAQLLCRACTGAGAGCVPQTRLLSHRTSLSRCWGQAEQFENTPSPQPLCSSVLLGAGGKRMRPSPDVLEANFLGGNPAATLLCHLVHTQQKSIRTLCSSLGGQPGCSCPRGLPAATC